MGTFLLLLDTLLFENRTGITWTGKPGFRLRKFLVCLSVLRSFSNGYFKTGTRAWASAEGVPGALWNSRQLYWCFAVEQTTSKHSDSKAETLYPQFCELVIWAGLTREVCWSGCSQRGLSHSSVGSQLPGPFGALRGLRLEGLSALSGLSFSSTLAQAYPRAMGRVELRGRADLRSHFTAVTYL